ncbi:MAG: LPS export ABC transporter permease LptG [Chlorobiaceae bacterium]|nr:LPS export ABC transporter permease LptG [Chlorobiaceae bacterium]NTV59754.1 LPS export ABC transporter permease LptG [Chlorobiaceae bacterium]
MKILDRYIFNQFIRTFLFTSIAFVFLFIIITMMENLGKLMDSKMNLFEIAHYYALMIPSTLIVTSPVCALLSSILVAGRLSFSSELPAIRSAGVSMKQFLVPFSAGGALIFAFNLFNACWLSPAAYSWTAGFEKRFPISSRSSSQNINIHILEPGNRIVSIGILENNSQTPKKVSIEEFSDVSLRSRADADSMNYDRKSGKWILKNVTTRTFSGESEVFTREQSRPVKLSFSPRSLYELNLKPDEMNITSHSRYLKEKQQAGFSGLEKSIVQFHTKLSMPLASFIIIFIGVPISSRKKRGGLASEIGITLFIGFIFLGMQKVIAIAGYQGALNPVLAAWLPDIIFVAAGYGIFRIASE